MSGGGRSASGPSGHEQNTTGTLGSEQGTAGVPEGKKSIVRSCKGGQNNPTIPKGFISLFKKCRQDFKPLTRQDEPDIISHMKLHK